jgi:hypothetical protein
MPSEYSLYRKIQVVLDIAKAAQLGSWVELKTQIISQRPPNFLTRQYDVKHDTMVQEVSERSIRKTVNVCRALGFIDDRGDLTAAGRKAVRQAQFDKALAERVREFLREKRVKMSMLNDLVQKSLRSRPVIMPTAAQLWEASDSGMSLLLFSQMLTLLSQCGGADSSQRKVYLEFSD